MTFMMNSVKFTAKVIGEIDNGPAIMKSLRVGVFEVQCGAERQVGEYIRNYVQFFRTFFHFQKNGADYALYSPHYTTTRVMKLPSCVDIGGEEPHAFGFCPTDFYVPWQSQEDEEFSTAEFGFVAGCIWGEDSSWKIEYLDLSAVESGVLKRDNRFGRIELPDRCSLEQAISLWRYSADEPYISIAVQRHFNLVTGKAIWE